MILQQKVSWSQRKKVSRKNCDYVPFAVSQLLSPGFHGLKCFINGYISTKIALEGIVNSCLLCKVELLLPGKRTLQGGGDCEPCTVLMLHFLAVPEPLSIPHGLLTFTQAQKGFIQMSSLGRHKQVLRCLNQLSLNAQCQLLLFRRERS